MRALAVIAVLLLGVAAHAAPTYVGSGAAAVTASTTTCTPTMPASIVANDILISVSCGEGTDDGVGQSLSTANGFTLVGSANGSSGPGAEANPEGDCAWAWKRAVGGDSAPVWADSGDNTTCAVHQFRGVKTSGNPWDDTPTSGNDSNANDTTAVIPGYTSTTNGQLIVLIQGTSNNATATTNCGAVTNADLASLTERFDSSNTLGLGSGHCIITGEKATAGSIASSTLTMSATTFKAAFAIGLASPAAGDCTVTTDIGSYTACVGYDSGDATVTVTTSGATLLIAMNSNESSDAVTTSVSGASLTWTSVGSNTASSGAGKSQIWWAYSSGALSSQGILFDNTTGAGGIACVMAFAGAASSGPTNFTNSTDTTQMNWTISATAGSFLTGIGMDWLGNNQTALANSTKVGNHLDASGSRHQAYYTTSSVSGSTQFGATSGSGGIHVASAVEVPAGSGCSGGGGGCTGGTMLLMGVGCK